MGEQNMKEIPLTQGKTELFGAYALLNFPGGD
jgi:hypothetical protein